MSDNGLYLLITPLGKISIGSHIEYLDKQQLIAAFESGKFDDLQFVDHLEFDFDSWNVHVEEGRTPAVLIGNVEALVPEIKEKVIRTLDL